MKSKCKRVFVHGHTQRSVTCTRVLAVSIIPSSFLRGLIGPFATDYARMIGGMSD